MPLSNEELQEVNDLQHRIAGAHLAAKDVRQDGFGVIPIVEQLDWKEYREFRARVGESGYAELERIVAKELIPQIREYVPDYPNPFEQDKGAQS